MWQKALQPYVQSGRLVVLGVVQEQHPDRARLYRQWRQLDWPIFVDTLNLLDLTVVPVPVAIDESGIVRFKRLDPRRQVKGFVEQDYPPTTARSEYNHAALPDPDQLSKTVESAPTAAGMRDLGDALFLRGADENLSRAIEAYTKATHLDPNDSRARFRLGVAMRRRYESKARQPGDGQAAVDHWATALAQNPNQYIWRRRIQQYGPRLDKPYNFYSWVAQARDEIQARSETPVGLAVEPSGSETAPPASKTAPQGATYVNRDPQSRVQQDQNQLVEIESVVTPRRVQPGGSVRARVTFRLDDKAKPLWNNEADGLSVWVEMPDALRLIEGQFTVPNPRVTETREVRSLEFEIATTPTSASGPVSLRAYSLYYVCEQAGGVCRYLRQDFTIAFEVDPAAVGL